MLSHSIRSAFQIEDAQTTQRFHKTVTHDIGHLIYILVRKLYPKVGMIPYFIDSVIVLLYFLIIFTTNKSKTGGVVIIRLIFYKLIFFKEKRTIVV